MEDEQGLISEETEQEGAQESPPAKKRPFWMLYVFGAALIAAVGFGTAVYLFYDPDQKAMIGDMQAAQAALNDTLETQAARLEQLEQQDQAAEIKAAEGRLQQALTTIQSSLTITQNRLKALENRPIASVDLSGENDQIFADIQAELNAQRALISELKAPKSAPKTVTYISQMAQILQAIEVGLPYDAPLNDIIKDGITVPPALQGNAAKGVTALSDLQARFPDIARTVLAQSRDGAGQSSFVDFLKTQFAIRSLEPKEGSSVDAVLSRSEAALAQGDLPAALTQLDTLADINLPALQVWRQEAELRNSVMQGAIELQANLQKGQAK